MKLSFLNIQFQKEWVYSIGYHLIYYNLLIPNNNKLQILFYI